MLQELVKLTDIARSQKVAMSSSQTRLLDGDSDDNDAVKATGRQTERPSF